MLRALVNNIMNLTLFDCTCRRQAAMAVGATKGRDGEEEEEEETHQPAAGSQH
jgi:hypothetical protein